MDQRCHGLDTWIMARFMIRSVYVTKLLTESLVSFGFLYFFTSCCVDHVLNCTWLVLESPEFSESVSVQMNGNFVPGALSPLI